MAYLAFFPVKYFNLQGFSTYFWKLFLFLGKYAQKTIVLWPDFWANASVEEHEADVGEDLGQEGLGHKVVVDDVDL